MSATTGHREKYLCLSIVCGLVGLLCGCGSSHPDPKGVPGLTTAAAAAPAEPEIDPEPDGLSYAPSASNLEGEVEGYVFGFQAELSLGGAERNTLGEHPGYVNVIAPVSGTASLTNETPGGYTATGEGQQYPELQAVALFPSGSTICQHDPGEYGDASDGNFEDSYYAVNPFYADNGASLCAASIATFTPPLAQACGGYGEGESLASGESLGLNITPDGGSEEGSGDCGSDFDPGYFVLSGIPTAEADKIIRELSTPRAWALTASPSNAPCPKQAVKAAGEYSPLASAIESQPSGFKGCVVYSHNRL